MLDLSTPRILTVTELTRSIRGILETEFPFVTVTGEISNLRQPYSGHLYCTLKDEDSQLKAVLFKTQQKYLRELPEEGQKIICRGRISVYEPRGEYQLIIDYIERLGTGELQIAFENLKLKLAREGLFDQEPKKEIPRFPASVRTPGKIELVPINRMIYPLFVKAARQAPACQGRRQDIGKGGISWTRHF
ncbi:MAG: exodeoxyribonuclease VII large subunit [Desulfobulbaceae bacterium]